MTQRLPRLALRSQLRIQQLNMILRLIERGSVSAAAEDLKLSQSAVTKALKEVESIFGVPLFHREPRGLRLTIYGEAVECFARDVLLGLDETIETIRGRLRGEEGAVSIGVSPGRPQQLLTMGLRQLKSTHPRLTIQLRSGNCPTLLSQLDAGVIDFALLATPPSLDRERYAHVPVGSEAVMALVHPRHPLLRRERISADALLDTGWALPPRDEPLRELVSGTMMAFGVDQPLDVIEVHSSRAALELAAGMDLIVFAPETEALPYLHHGQLRSLPLPFTLPHLPLGMVRFRRRQLRPGSLTVLRDVTGLIRNLRRQRHVESDLDTVPRLTAS